MNGEPTPSRRARLALDAAAAGRRAARALDRAADAPPVPGELFVLRETAAFAVEWLVVERHGSDHDRLFVVPADTNPLLGGDDWTVSGDAAAGPLSLRCGFGLWLPASRLEGRLRVGAVTPASLAQAARWCAAVRGAGRAGGDPEYEDWVEATIAPAHAAVAAAVGAEPAAVAAPAVPAVRAATVMAAQPGVAAGRRRRWLIVAAAAVPLVAVLGLGGALLRQSDLADRLRAERNALQSELRRPAPGAPLPAGGGGAAVQEDVLLNPPLVSLRDEVLRGQGARVVFDSAPRRLVLLACEPRPGGVFPEYLLEIRDDATGRLQWSGGGLRLDAASGLVTVGLRQRLLPAGRYEIRLDGLRAGRRERAGTYFLEVEAAAAAPGTAPPPPPAIPAPSP
jgi:hypothetical protein